MTVVSFTMRGRITISAAIRKQLGIKGSTRVQLRLREGKIMIVPVRRM